MVDEPYLDESSLEVRVDAAGGIEPYSWSAENLPEGLFISTDGLISGTPTMEGNYQVAVQAQDADSPPETAQKNVPLTVKAFQITGPDKIGVVTEFSQAKKQVYTVTVPDGKDPTKVALQPLPPVSPQSGFIFVIKKDTAGNTITFEVKGTHQSKDENDVILRIIYDSQPLPQPIKQLSVVVPFIFANLESSTQVVVPETKALTRYSSPSYDFSAQDQIDGTWCLQGIWWHTVLSITVHDQFDHELGNLYDGAQIAEQFFDQVGPLSGTIPLNQQLNNGIYSDPTGVTKGFAAILQQTPVPTDKQWILDHTPPPAALHGVELEEAGTITIPEDTKTVQVTVGKLPMRDKITRKQKLDPANQLTITYQ